MASGQKVIPELEGKVDGLATIVPVPLGAYVEITAMLKNNNSVNLVNKHFEDISRHAMKGIIEFSSDPLVSTDIIAE